MDERATMEVITEWVDALNAHDLDRMAALYAPAYRGRDVTRQLDCRGFADVRSDLEQWMQAFPDLQVRIERLTDEAPTVGVCWTFTGTHTRPFLRIPPTGRNVSVIGFSLLDFQGGRLVSGLHLWDLSGMLRSMRLLPELPRRSAGPSPAH